MVLPARWMYCRADGFRAVSFQPIERIGLCSKFLTEIAVLVWLYCAGVKMPAPATFRRWRAPLQLAVVSMAITVGLVTLFGHYWLSLPLGGCSPLGAVIAPTDPVLATEVQVRHAGDSDDLRFTLTCEAGINDGSGFPFIMLGLGLLGLHDFGNAGGRWLLMDVLWACGRGRWHRGFVEWGCGCGLARLSLRTLFAGYRVSFESFLGLGLIAFVYGNCLLLECVGDFSLFSAQPGVALRHTELETG